MDLSELLTTSLLLLILTTVLYLNFDHWSKRTIEMCVNSDPECRLIIGDTGLTGS